MPDARSAPMVTTKTERLMTLVAELLTRGEGTADLRGIVFVEQVALTMPLAHLLNRDLSKRRISSIVEACSGIGSMSQSKVAKVLEEFKNGRVQVCGNEERGRTKL